MGPSLVYYMMITTYIEWAQMAQRFNALGFLLMPATLVVGFSPGDRFSSVVQFLAEDFKICRFSLCMGIEGCENDVGCTSNESFPFQKGCVCMSVLFNLLIGLSSSLVHVVIFSF